MLMITIVTVLFVYISLSMQFRFVFESVHNNMLYHVYSAFTNTRPSI